MPGPIFSLAITAFAARQRKPKLPGYQ